MFKLSIKPMKDFQYGVFLSDDMGFVKWSTTCNEIDLSETIEKVLRVTENLRKLPA